MPTEKIADPTAAWLQERIAFEARPENTVLVPAELMKPHPLVKAAATAVRVEIAGLQKNRENQERVRDRNAPPQINWAALEKPNWQTYLERGIMEGDPEALPMRVAIESTDRALRLWDAVLKACEARGLRVSVGNRRVSVCSGVDRVELRLAEKVDQVKRAVKIGGDIVMARQPTGCLRLFVTETKIEDSTDRLLEQQLNDVLVRIYRTIASRRTVHASAVVRRQHDEAVAQLREQERAAAAEATRLHEEEVQRLQAEQAAATERERTLLAEANAWRDAAAIRGYAAHIAAAAGGMASPALKEWLTWAESVAERLDPTSKRIK
jgi:hypothetical protein